MILRLGSSFVVERLYWLRFCDKLSDLANRSNHIIVKNYNITIEKKQNISRKITSEYDSY